MSYASEEQWTPTGVICPICGHESLALGNRVKGHICIPDFLDTDVRFSTPSRESFHRTVNNEKIDKFLSGELKFDFKNGPALINLQQMAKSVLGVK